MFRIVAEPKAWWPVTWPGVAEDGKIIENKIEMRFLLLKVDAGVEMMRAANAAKEKTAASEDRVIVSREFAKALKPFVRDWRGVAAENGEPLPFNDDNLALLMNEPGVFEKTLEAYRDCLAGQPSAPQKPLH